MATAVSDGFSLYTVEFTYGELAYAMEGDATVPLSDVLAHVGLEGEPTAVSVSNPELFSASSDSGQWTVTAHKPFTSTEWMKVTVNGVEYEVTVTDALAAGSAQLQAQGGEGGPTELQATTGSSDGVVYQMEKVGAYDMPQGKRLIFVAGGAKADYLSALPSNAGVLVVGEKHGDSDEYKDRPQHGFICYVDVVRTTAGFDNCPHGTLNGSLDGHYDYMYNCWWGGVESLGGSAYADVEFPYGSKVQAEYRSEAKALKDAIDAARAVAGDKNVTAEQVASAEKALRQALEKAGTEVVSYFCLSGSGSTWAKGSSDPLTFVFKRSIDDDITFGAFTGTKVDGADVPESAFTKAEGSLVLSLTAAYLETLPVGDHELVVSFEDGEAAATFAVKAAGDAAKTAPRTGDALPVALLAVTAVAGAVVLFVSRSRARKPVRADKRTR